MYAIRKTAKRLLDRGGLFFYGYLKTCWVTNFSLCELIPTPYFQACHILIIILSRPIMYYEVCMQRFFNSFLDIRQAKPV